MKKNKVLLVGFLGFRTNQLDGQTVKTRNVLNLLKSKSHIDVSYYDTQEIRYSKLSVFSFLKEIFFARNIIIAPAHSSIKTILPFIYFVSLFTRSNIIYIQIGGWLSSFLEDKKYLRGVLSNIRVQLIETELLMDELKSKYQFSNIDYFPNFRYINTFPSETATTDDTLKIVFMARINQMKGLDYIASLTEQLTKENLDKKVIIDLYGPIAEEDEMFFKDMLANHAICKYKGVLKPDGIYPVLSKYDLMLLPTHYYTEGFPGSILDAYISGIPVIATRWKHAEEFIDDEKTGFIIPFEHGEQELYHKVRLLLDNKLLLDNLKINAREKSHNYTPDAAFERLKKYIK